MVNLNTKTSKGREVFGVGSGGGGGGGGSLKCGLFSSVRGNNTCYVSYCHEYYIHKLCKINNSITVTFNILCINLKYTLAST